MSDEPRPLLHSFADDSARATRELARALDGPAFNSMMLGHWPNVPSHATDDPAMSRPHDWWRTDTDPFRLAQALPKRTDDTPASLLRLFRLLAADLIQVTNHPTLPPLSRPARLREEVRARHEAAVVTAADLLRSAATIDRPRPDSPPLQRWPPPAASGEPGLRQWLRTENRDASGEPDLRRWLNAGVIWDRSPANWLVHEWAVHWWRPDNWSPCHRHAIFELIQFTVERFYNRDRNDPPQQAGRNRFRQLACETIRDVFATPAGPRPLAPAWQTSTAVALARRCRATHDYSPLPILADALQDAGCDRPDVLDHLRAPTCHGWGCWVLDGLLDPAILGDARE